MGAVTAAAAAAHARPAEADLEGRMRWMAPPPNSSPAPIMQQGNARARVAELASTAGGQHQRLPSTPMYQTSQATALLPLTYASHGI